MKKLCTRHAQSTTVHVGAPSATKSSLCRVYIVIYFQSQNGTQFLKRKLLSSAHNLTFHTGSGHWLHIELKGVKYAFSKLFVTSSRHDLQEGTTDQ